MPTELILDSREHGLNTLLTPMFHSSTLAPMRVERLDIGDIHICHEGRPRIVIERKTFEDLASALHTGRYREQKARLLAARCADLQVIYLVEGTWSADFSRQFYGGRTEATLLSVLTRLMCKDHIPFIMLPSLEASARWLVHLTQRLTTDPTEFDSTIAAMPNAATAAATAYAPLIRIAKKDNMTPDACYRIMLANIPGVSPKIAEVIASKWPRLAQLAAAMSSGGDVELSNIITDPAAARPRRLGLALATRIRNVFVGEEGV